jgi:hypothetical protein
MLASTVAAAEKSGAGAAMSAGGDLAAVITDGLTNSRLDVYELDSMRRLRRREGWSRPSEIIVSADGRLWFDIPDAVEHFLGQLAQFERVGDISVIVPVARGAVCALLDARGALMPEEVEDLGGAVRRGGAISYINAVSAETDALFDEMMGPLERYRSYGLPPNFTGCAIPARTIVSLAHERPELLREAAAFVFGPEIMARLLCCGASSLENEGLEPTYLMSHTGLWKSWRWSGLARRIDDFVMERTGRRLLGGLMPAAPAASSRVFDRAGEATAAAYGLDVNAVVLNGGHDSTIADLPVIAACERAFGKREFIHFQAGSWGMARLMGVRDLEELPEEGFGKNVMFQGDLYGNPVLTASAPSGVEFQHYAGEGPAGRGAFLDELGLERLPAGGYDLRTLEDFVSRREIFITPGVAAGIGPYPESVSRVYGMDELKRDGTGELACIALNLETSIMATASIELAAAGRRKAAVVISAGAAEDELFRLLLACLNPGREVYYLAAAGGDAVTETASDGGLLLALEHVRGIPPNEMDVSGLGYSLLRIEPEKSLVEGLRSYREEFEKRARR